MAVYIALMKVDDSDYYRNVNDGSKDSNYHKPRTVEFGGHIWATNAETLAAVEAGTARFDYRPAPRPYNPDGMVYVVEHEGATLADREENWSDDSDWYALYWNGEGLGRTTYRTTRGGGTDDNYVTIDPTPEVLEAVRAWQAAANYRLARDLELDAFRKALDEVVTAAKGKRVEVVKGRKVPIGVKGEVFWVGEGRSYNRWDKPGLRLGVRGDNGETYWIDDRNVRVIDIDEDDIPREADFRRPEDELRDVARRTAEASWGERGARLGVRRIA